VSPASSTQAHAKFVPKLSSWRKRVGCYRSPSPLVSKPSCGKVAVRHNPEVQPFLRLTGAGAQAAIDDHVWSRLGGYDIYVFDCFETLGDTYRANGPLVPKLNSASRCSTARLPTFRLTSSSISRM